MLDKASIEISCEQCRSKFSVTLQQVADQKTVSCRKCGVKIHLTDVGGKAKQALREMNKFKEQMKSFSQKYK